MIKITDLNYAYGKHQALQKLNLEVVKKEIFGFLGPNGSGKTTLFRILSTLLKPQSGKVEIAGAALEKDSKKIREKVGVVFQSPSLDGKLTVRENLMHQGHLYGLSGKILKEKIAGMLQFLGLKDRESMLVDKLSGGLKRRVDIAKALLHDPELLILDEPSTALDPAARADVWSYLKSMREEKGITLLLTTHLMDEAEHCNRVAILDHGKMISLGTPTELKRLIGGSVVVLKAHEHEALKTKLEQRFKVQAKLVEEQIQIEHPKAAEFVTDCVEAFPGEIESIGFRKPSLEDVFLHQTGHSFWDGNEAEA